MSKAITSGAGPSGEKIYAAAPVAKESKDTRVQVGGSVKPVVAAYVQNGTAIKRTYMRPTEMTIRVDKSSYEFLDKITYSGTIRWRTYNTSSLALGGQRIRVTVKANKSSSGATLLTKDVTTNSSGNWSFAVEDPKLYPGTAHGHYVRADHTPSASHIWKAPAVATTYAVTPFHIIGNVFHTGGWNHHEGYYENPWVPHVTTPAMASGGNAYIHATLSAEPRHRRDEMDQYNLWAQVKFSMWASAVSNLSGVWRTASATPRGAAIPRGGIPDWKHAEAFWRSMPNADKNQIRSSESFSVAGFNRGSGLSGAKALAKNDIAFGVVTSRLGIGGMTAALRQATPNKGVAMIVLWIRVEDDAAATSRWEGGVYETNWNSPWHHHALQPTYAPLVIGKQRGIAAGHTWHRPGHNI